MKFAALFILAAPVAYGCAWLTVYTLRFMAAWSANQ